MIKAFELSFYQDEIPAYADRSAKVEKIMRALESKVRSENDGKIPLPFYKMIKEQAERAYPEFKTPMGYRLFREEWDWGKVYSSAPDYMTPYTQYMNDNNEWVQGSYIYRSGVIEVWGLSPYWWSDEFEDQYIYESSFE